MENQEQPVEQNKNQKWYAAHKNDINYKIRMREARRAYYERNKADQSEKALDRYYIKIAKKALAE